MYPIDSNKVNNRFILCINLTKISNIYEAVISILLLSNLRRKLFNPQKPGVANLQNEWFSEQHYPCFWLLDTMPTSLNRYANSYV
jgi:hypothetical protein